MTPSRPFGDISRACVRCLLAWIAALLVSVSLAAAISSAIVGAASDREQPDVDAGQRTGEFGRFGRRSVDDGAIRSGLQRDVQYDPGINRPRVQRRLLYVGLIIASPDDGPARSMLRRDADDHRLLGQNRGPIGVDRHIVRRIDVPLRGRL